MIPQSSRLKPMPKEDFGSNFGEPTGDESDNRRPGPSDSTNANKRKRSETSKAGGSTPAATVVGKDSVSGRPAKKPRGKRGFLQRIAEMPLELLFEISGLLDPMDVLNLARTTKALRAILMRKSSSDIWQAALANAADLPPFPEGELTEPQWVDLLYGKSCQFCGRTNSTNTQTYGWEARVRGCFKCVLAVFNVPRHWRGEDLLPVTPSLLVEGQSRGNDRGRHYHRGKYDELYKEQGKFHKKGVTDWKGRYQWLEGKRASMKTLKQHAKLWEDWVESVRSARENELKELREQRKIELRQRLEDSGYSSFAVKLAFENPNFYNVQCVSSLLKKGITDRVWKGVEGSITALVDEYMTESTRLQDEENLKKRFKLLAEVHQASVKGRPADKAILSACDLFQLPDIKRAFLAEPLSNDLDPHVLEDIRERMSSHIDEWTKTAKQQLTEMLDASEPILGSDKVGVVDESHLNLAVAFFKCDFCIPFAKEMHGGDILHHQCGLFGRRVPSASMSDEHVRAFIDCTGQLPRPASGISFASDASAAVSIFVKKLHLDPASVTAKELDILDPIFQFPATAEGARLMYTWRGLLQDRRQLKIEEASVLDEEASALIREMLDERARGVRASNRSSRLYCRHCRYPAGSSVELREHLRDAHGKDPATDADVWIHPDAENARVKLAYYKQTGATVI